MFTPQEVREKTFVKAVFGGYDMETVDEFLEPLTEDYISLYKENAILKSKMKVLVEKLEEYRSQEQSMRKALLSAQQTADIMVAEAEKKCARLVAEAEEKAANRGVDWDKLEAEEKERMNCAKQTALSFIELVERDIRGHLDLLESLKSRDLSLEVEARQSAAEKPFDFDMAPSETPVKETAEDIANEIEQNLNKMMEREDGVSSDSGRLSNTIKFSNLQFGAGYDPTNG